MALPPSSRRYPLGKGGVIPGTGITAEEYEQGQMAAIGRQLLYKLGIDKSEVVASSFHIGDISNDGNVTVLKVEWQTATDQMLADGTTRKMNHSRVLVGTDVESRPELGKYGMVVSPEVAAYMDGDYLEATRLATERAARNNRR